MIIHHLNDDKSKLPIELTGFENMTTKPQGMHAIIGPNGAGKSTLLKALTFYHHKPSLSYESKSIVIRNIHKMIAYMPQQQNRLHISVIDFLKLVERKISFQDTERLLNQFNINKTPYDSVNTTSGGEFRLLCYIQTFLQPTPIMFLDEPLTSLDVHHQLALLNHIKKESQSREIWVVLHEWPLYLHHFDSVIAINQAHLEWHKNLTEIESIDLEQLFQININDVNFHL